jgi:hypothetical protein
LPPHGAARRRDTPALGYPKQSTTMNENKTLSILHRLPVVLAVTAASYGLNVSQAQTSASHDAKPRTSTQAAPAAAKRPS